MLRWLTSLRTSAPAASLCAGVVIGEVYSYLSVHEHFSMAPVLLAILVLLIGLVGWSSVLSGVLIGLTASYAYAPNQRPILVGGDLVFPVQVASPPRRPRVGEVILSGYPLMEGFHSYLVSIRAQDVPWRAASTVEEGDTVWIRAECVPVEPPTHPFSFDARLFRENTISVCKARFLSYPVEATPTLTSQGRIKIMQNIRGSPFDREGVAIFLSMTFGFRDLLSVPLEKACKTLGLTHLLVVSGYQVTLVFGAVLAATFWIARRIVRGANSRVVAACIGLGVTFLYVVLCGAENASVRALCAGACAAWQLVDEHRTRFFQRVTVAMLAILILQPLSCFDLGVQLTFVALIGIGLGQIGHEERSRISSTVRVCWTVWCLTSAVSVLWFGSVSLLAFPVNVLLAAPWALWNCYIGSASFALSFLPFEGSGCLIHGVAWVNELVSTLLISLADIAQPSVFLFEEVWGRISAACGLVGGTLPVLLTLHRYGRAR